jgi:hypothetical protein
MKALAVLLVLIWSVAISGESHARYRPMTFLELSARAELVVLGSIASTTEETFDLEVESTIRSRPGVPSATKGQRLQIAKFRDWTCARRWTAYAAGQRAVMFIERRAGAWHVLGGGNEGEMPVADDSAFVDGNVSHGFGEWTVYNARYFGGRLALADVLRAVVEKRPLRRAHVEGVPHNKPLQSDGASRRR